MNLKNIFRENLRILERKLEIIRAATEHAQTKGFLLEQAVSDFLSCMLPNNLGITSGFIVDSNNDTSGSKDSNQVDLMVYEKSKAATFFSASGIVTMPCEFVHLVVEVKTTLKRDTSLLPVIFLTGNMNHN